MFYLERKIYRMSRFRKNPTIDDLKRKTGKDEKIVRQSVKTSCQLKNNNLADKVRPQSKEKEQIFVVKKTKNPCYARVSTMIPTGLEPATSTLSR